jgi:hypothetical protein
LVQQVSLADTDRKRDIEHQPLKQISRCSNQPSCVMSLPLNIMSPLYNSIMNFVSNNLEACVLSLLFGLVLLFILGMFAPDSKETIKKEKPRKFVMFSIVDWDETEILNPQKIELSFGFMPASVERLADFFSGLMRPGTAGNFEHFHEDEWVLINMYADLEANGRYRFRKFIKK